VLLHRCGPRLAESVGEVQPQGDFRVGGLEDVCVRASATLELPGLWVVSWLSRMAELSVQAIAGSDISSMVFN